MPRNPEKSAASGQGAPRRDGKRKSASASTTPASSDKRNGKAAQSKWLRPVAVGVERTPRAPGAPLTQRRDEWVNAIIPPAAQPAAEAVDKVTKAAIKAAEPQVRKAAAKATVRAAIKMDGETPAKPALEAGKATNRRKTAQVPPAPAVTKAVRPARLENAGAKPTPIAEPPAPATPPSTARMASIADAKPPISEAAPSARAEVNKPERVEKPVLANAAKAAAAPSAQGSADASFGLRYPLPHFETFANNIARAVEQVGKVVTAYVLPREKGQIKSSFAEDIADMARSLGQVAEYHLADPKRAFEAQTALTTQFVNLWAETLKRFQGGAAAPVAQPEKSDKRFADAEWRDNPFFDFIKQAYVLTSRWADDLVRRHDELEPHERDKALFYLKQVTAALSPTNFLATNPELLRATFEESGENIVRGLKMLAEDIEAGKGNLRIRQSDARAFKLGVNLAMTPGKVVFRNALIELIQYEPSTPQAYRRPLLIVPPWINKFYILDLNPEKSFIRWAVSQGLTVFVVSWVNPDERMAEKGFEAYMREGILTAVDCVEQATGESEISAIGYCVGGTLLAATLAYMSEVGDKRIASATFFTTQVDFTDPGDLKVFVDAEQLKSVEERMAGRGYLEGSAMANAFNMLRPNDLIWSYYVSNYLKGKEPMPFDLLVWNSDSTRMPAANHNFYLRHCYFQNDLSNGRMELGGVKLDIGKVTIPVYELAAKEDHIAPARSVFAGAKLFGGPVRYVMAGSGHIAGVVNPPAKPKYQFWSGGPPSGEFDAWVAAAKETPGSWWPDWIAWIAEQAPEQVPARKPGAGKLKALGDAPGDYVRVKS